ncbi:MAG: DoxX family protein [Deferribacteres bacterium]|nr:DoxX family protein [candidate division KSB1 bacterium]MCB9500329.1 DoxX family protein [Deferribacteres bacterium]
MNILLWVLQILLALHTVTGALWKFSNSAGQTMQSLGAIPDGLWMILGIVEILCAVGLVIPALIRSFGKLVPIVALFIASEMLLFCGVHLASGDPAYGPMAYWLVVAAFCAFIAYGRLVLKPI